jgi:hypothetical protein
VYLALDGILVESLEYFMQEGTQVQPMNDIVCSIPEIGPIRKSVSAIERPKFHALPFSLGLPLLQERQQI